MPVDFEALVEPYRRELLVHCYRMLGSVPDAEDALQETLLAAWRGLPAFEGRASLRTWLYRIATRTCLNVRRAAGRRRAREWDMPGVAPPAPTGTGDVPWLEPCPDAMVRAARDVPAGPEARYEQAEAISLAFVAALQTLPPRQLAVLLLRDVLGFSGAEAAAMLGTTAGAVAAALKRARAGLPAPPVPAAPGSPAERALVARFVRAYESGDAAALVALLTDDVRLTMPPIPLEYRGRDAVAGFCAAIFAAGRRVTLVPARANGQPAFGAYPRDGAPAGLFVLTLDGDRIAALTRFDDTVLHRFGLPPAPARV